MHENVNDNSLRVKRFAPIEIGTGVFQIDLGFQDTAGVIASYLLVGDGELALIETGPSSTRGNLEWGLGEIGYALADVSRVIPTHIHLDHAGAAGAILRDYPKIRMSINAAGAPFLIEPDRLVKSAARLYGEQMDELWGEVVPAAADRVDSIIDGDRLQIAGRSLLVRATPGHAGSHLAYLDEETGTLFTGDAAGARIAPLTSVQSTVSPPEIDFTLWETTVQTMRDLSPQRLALTHFGVFEDVEEHLAQILPNGLHELDLVRQVLTTGGSEEDATEMILAGQRAIVADLPEPAAILERMELAMPAWLATLGLQRVLKKAGELE